MQIAASGDKVYVSYITDPQTVGPCWHIAFYQVLILAVAMVGPCRMARSWARKRKPEIAQYAKKGITAWHPVILEHALEHKPKLVVPYAWIHRAYLGDCIYDAHETADILLVMRLVLIVRLFRMVKQSAGIFDCITKMPGEALYCLTPDFFLIRMPCSSAMSISTFKARFLSSLLFNLASRAFIFFSNASI